MQKVSPAPVGLVMGRTQKSPIDPHEPVPRYPRSVYGNVQMARAAPATLLPSPSSNT